MLVVALMGGTTSVSAAQNAQTRTTQQSKPGGPGPRPDDGSHAGGQVSAVSGSTITVAGRAGNSQDILTTADTTFQLDGAAVSLSDIKAGQFLMAEGTTDSAGAFTATAIHASTSQPQGGPGGHGPGDGSHAGGQVSAVSGSTITVAGRDGNSQDILTTADTTFQLDGAAADLSAIKAGQFIHADGATDSAGAFTATAIHASTSQPQGGPGGHGPDDGNGAPPVQP